MADWNTRLVVTREGAVITPISQFTPTFTTNYTILNSVEADNLGYVRQPQTFTFTMSIQAIGPTVAELTKLALDGSTFDIAVAVASGDDWSFKSMAFTGCVITSTNPSSVVIDGAPAATFNCMCLNPVMTS